MLNEKVAKLLNEQVNKEFYSAYLYLSFSNFYKELGLDGFANWYNVQAQEERDHAMLGIVGGHLDDDTSFITACAALKEAGIRINSVNYGSSNTTTLIGVNDSDATAQKR